IPAELGNLNNLLDLILGDNQLSGSIPTSLGNLSKLQYLSLRNGKLSGSIPAELGNLSNLLTLDLVGNQLTGNIPAPLGNLTKLLYLSLDWNALYTTDNALRIFLNSKNVGWENTQTVAPPNPSAKALTTFSIQITWQTIPYTSDPGGYRVFYS